MVKLAYRLGRSRATGLLSLFSTGQAGAERIWIRRGQVVTEAGNCAAREERRLAVTALGASSYQFAGGQTSERHTHRQFGLAAWARKHLESQMDAGQARALVDELAGVRLLIKPGMAPDPTLCDQTDMRMVEAMRRPRRLDQIWPLARTPRFRLLSFLHFLRGVGALGMVGVAAPAPRPDASHRLLGVSPSADSQTVKRAYRRLARALHPDLHPEVSSARRRLLERKLAAVTHAYRELSTADQIH